MIHTAARAFLNICSAALVASAAFAGDYYVDSTNDNNVNAGTTPGAPWKTIQFAMSQFPASGTAAQTIHLAPGAYSQGTGETFPISCRPAIKLIGDLGPELTVIDASNTGQTAFTYYTNFSSAPYSFPVGTGISGVRIHNATTGVAVFAGWNNINVTISNCVVEGSSGYGVYADTGQIPHNGSFTLTLTNTWITNCGFGFYGQAYGGGGSMSATNCIFESGVHTGVEIAGGSGFVTAALAHCMIRGFQLYGAYTIGVIQGGATLTVTDSVIVDNLSDGVRAESQSTSGTSGCTITRCTVAKNGGKGGKRIGSSSIGVSGSIFSNNAGGDLDPGASSSNSDIADGSGGTANGNIAANPMFRSPSTGDYRLSWGSPCIDKLLLPQAKDYNGVGRQVDGNLNLIELADLGAYEFLPLDATGDFVIGNIVNFESWGPDQLTYILVADGGIAPTLPTMYGDVDIDLLSSFVLLIGTATSASPAQMPQLVPNDPQFIGSTFSFQALTVSPASANTYAFTNAFSKTVH
ncbi:MAG: DUF1565 domain-containing protein [Planctomycetes bacterium]|nr:DUF1565 domain-containing protein [Planctomycetota bacterium]